MVDLPRTYRSWYYPGDFSVGNFGDFYTGTNTRSEGLGISNNPHTPIHVRTRNFGASLPFAFATTCRFAYPPVGADRVFTQPTRIFTSGLPADWLPFPPPDITTGATGQVPLAGLSPARTPTSFAAPLRTELCCLGPSSLTGPIRPTCRHISISPHSGLYGMPSLCVSA